ncbi:hypothetical protein MFIFM68171_07213 [Madurella fahalii]|uniref:Uncharacterized protein n=1 Tax=Madurella fahalii TaxID=1157608 RepID=A0ABQ0GGX4_9PEZI
MPSLSGEPADGKRARLTEMPAEILRNITSELVPMSGVWDTGANTDPQTRIISRTPIQGLQSRQIHAGRFSNLLQLALTCGTLSVFAREALYSRVRIDKYRTLIKLAYRLSQNTAGMRFNAGFVNRLEVDMHVERAWEETFYGWYAESASPWDEFRRKTLDYIRSVLSNEGQYQWLFDEPAFELCPSLAELRERVLLGNGINPGGYIDPVVATFFVILCHLPNLRTLVLRYNHIMDAPGYRFLGTRQVWIGANRYYRTIFRLISEATASNAASGITKSTAPPGTWPCPSLEHVEVYGIPGWRSPRRFELEYAPAWSFQTFPGLKSIKICIGRSAPAQGPTSAFSEGLAGDVVLSLEPEGWEQQHMKACVANLERIELDNTPFDFETLEQALTDAKQLRTLSIKIDNAGPTGEANPDANWNTVLPICSSRLESLDMLISWCRTAENDTFFFGPRRKLTCLPKMTQLRTLRTNLRSLFGGFAPLGGWQGDATLRIEKELEHRHERINAASAVELPASLEKLVLVEEGDARPATNGLPIWDDAWYDNAEAAGRIYSEQLKRFADKCKRGRWEKNWRINEITMLAVARRMGDMESGLDREGVVDAFAKVNGLRFQWGWKDEAEHSDQVTSFRPSRR